MMNDDIRKLLGGYATNTLTEDERKALFEAALEDQNLFNALQEEQALKDLLSDPISRAQVQRALETKPAPKIRWWAWSGAIGAVAAAVLIVAVVRNEKPQAKLADELASREIPAIPALPRAELKAAAPPSQPRAHSARRDSADTSSKRAPISPSAPPALDAASVQKDEKIVAARPAAVAEPSAPIQNQRNAEINAPLGGPSQNPQYQQAQNQFRAQTAASLSSNMMLGKQSGLSYSLLKRDAEGTFLPLPPGTPLNPGDAVRFTVVPVVSGSLSLEQLDASGRSNRILPGRTVAAGTTYTVPDSPIQVTDKDETFRLSLIPEATQPEADGELRAKKSMAKAKVAPQSASAPGRQAALSVDITIGPGKPR